MSAPLERAVEQLWPPVRWRDTRLLVGISGGADSVALLRALLKIAGTSSHLEAAHFNHAWRGAESDADQLFVSELCGSLKVKLHVGRAPGETYRSNTKSEEGARHLRYQFLTHTAYAIGARYVVTAHTASDRVETMLHNLFRGTGLAGVSAPTLARDLHHELVLVRPLLTCTRADVLAYLSQLDQAYRIDSSNENQQFQRNFIRHTLLPLLRERYGEQVDGKLASFSDIAEESLELLQELAKAYMRGVEQLYQPAFAAGCLPKCDTPWLAVPLCQRLPARWPVVHQALNFAWVERNWSLQSMTREHWRQLRTIWSSELSEEQLNRPLLRACRVVQYLPHNLELCRAADWIVIRQAAAMAPAMN